MAGIVPCIFILVDKKEFNLAVKSISERYKILYSLVRSEGYLNERRLMESEIASSYYFLLNREISNSLNKFLSALNILLTVLSEERKRIYNFKVREIYSKIVSEVGANKIVEFLESFHRDNRKDIDWTVESILADLS